jgi:phosphoglycolate phosphatase
MNNKPSTLIFDLDWTLFDSKDVYVWCIQKTIKWIDSSVEITPETIFRCVWMPWDDFYKALLPEGKKHLFERLRDLNRANYLTWVPEFWRLYPKTELVLEQLKNRWYILAVCTNASTKYKDAIFNAFDITKYFDEIEWFEKNGLSKSDMTWDIIRKYWQDAIFVWDRNHDLESAKNNWIPFIWCLYWFGNREELNGADYLIDRLEDILEITS